MSCPCGSDVEYAACCGPWHGGAPAPTALALMRARYAAYALGDAAYVRRTWHPTTRPRSFALDAGIEWQRLHVVDTEGGGPDDSTGVVEFVARYRRGGESATLRERSEFVRMDRRWLYLRGDVH